MQREEESLPQWGDDPLSTFMRDGVASTLDQLLPGDDLDVQSTPLVPTVAQQIGFPNAIGAAQVAASSTGA